MVINKNIRNLALLALIGYAFQYTITHLPNKETAQVSTVDPRAINPTAYAHFKQELEQQEQLAWDSLQTATSVSKKECLEKQEKDCKRHHQAMEQHCKSRQKRYPKLKPETIAFVEEVLRDFDINPIDVGIAPYKGQGSPAAANDTTIFIDEKEFEHYSPAGCKFFIAHEISHMKAQDQSLFESMCALSHRKKVSQSKKKSAINAFRRFQETRADVHALLSGGQEYAQGAFDFLHKLHELDGGDNPGITHPKTSERIKKAQEICSLMGWEVETERA